MTMLRIIGPKCPTPRTGQVVNTTSRSTNWSRGLSPFFLGPIDLYAGHKAQNVENAWQYSKLYPAHADATGAPTQAYWEWARIGWAREYADRYPMARGTLPLCALWNGERLGYIDSRKRIYVPLYAKAVRDTAAFAQLAAAYATAKRSGETLWLWDFDGYDHVADGLTLTDVINDPKRKMGHAFVLAALLTGDETFLQLVEQQP